MQSKAHSRESPTEQEVVEPVDFAEIACHVLTAVAANVGSVEDLLAGRPGSWEADLVRQIVHGIEHHGGQRLTVRARDGRVLALYHGYERDTADWGIHLTGADPGQIGLLGDVTADQRHV